LFSGSSSSMKIKIFFLLFFVCLNFTSAQLSPYEINGYVKYLFSSSENPQTSARYYDHQLHARLNTGWYPSDNFKGIMELRLRGYYGESVENTPGFVNQIKGKYDFMDLDAVLWNEKKSIGYGEIDRLYFDWNYNKFELTIGRQRIAWGTSWTWNPTDIFNPLSVLDFDYEERPAVDAVRAQYYTGAVSKLELAFKPARRKENVIAAGLISVNLWNYDFNLIGGIKQNKWLTGASWSGDIYGAGFRGELLLREGEKIIIPYSNYHFGNGNPIYSFVISGDYTFPNSFYIHTEILHNSIGAESLTALYQQAALNSGFLTASKWSLYQEFAYDFHPLVRGTFFGILNPNDKSWVIVPSVSYSVITNLDLLFLGMFFNGDSLTEFGSFGNAFFIRFKYSF
jgi:hypothetical protein